MSVLAYVVNLGDNNVAVIDTSTNTIITTIPVDPTLTIPRFIALTPDGRFAYVTNYANILSVIDTTTNTLAATIPLPVGNFSEGIDITPSGNFAYVANKDLNNVSVVNTTTNAVVATIPVGRFPYGVAITPNGSFAYVTNTGSDNVSVINTARNAVVATVPVGDGPSGIAITPDGRFVYVANESTSRTVFVIATSTNTVVASIAVGTAPTAIAITPDGNFAYVANAISSNVSVIDTGTNTVIATIPVGSLPFDIAITPDGSFVYVTNSGNDTVSVINTSTNTVVETFPVGDTPSGIAIANIGQQLENVSLTVTKADSPDPVKLGENLTYTIQVTNNGPDTASEVILTDTLPQGVDFISAASSQGTCSQSNGIVTCQLGTLDMNETVTATVTVKPTSTGTICNKVAVSTGGSASETPTNTAIQCTTVFETVCIETKRIFDTSCFEEVKQKTFRFPCISKNQNFECRVVETKCRVISITRREHCDLADVKLGIEVVIEFKNQNLSSQCFKGVVSFERNITLKFPECADVCCDAHAACQCMQSDDCTEKPCGNALFKRIYCMVKVTSVVKSVKHVQIEVPFLGDCNPCHRA